MADLPEPKSRTESYLAKAAGEDVEIPEEPRSRLEQYLNAIAENGGGGGGGGSSDTTHKLSTDDYNYNMANHSTTEPYDCVALWLLPAGVYEVPDNSVKAYYANTNGYSANKGTYICGGKGTNGTGIISLNAEYPSSGDYYAGRIFVDSPNGNPKGTVYLGALTQETGNSAMRAMSQKAVTDTINARLDNLTLLKISQTDYDNLQTKDANTLYIITGA